MTKKPENKFGISFMKRHNSKGIITTIMTILTLILCVIAIIGYNHWFNTYMGKQYTITETQNTNIHLIHDVIGDTLYLDNPYDENLVVLKVSIEGIDCGISDFEMQPGLNTINVLACAHKIQEPAVEVVVYSEKHVYSKYVFMDKIKLPKGAIIGGDNCEELNKILDDLSGNYYLTGDINCLSTKDWNNGSGFEPIGDTSSPFTGTLNGNGYTIYNLFMNHSEKETGMFGQLQNAKISNLNFDLLYINGLKKSSGALSGFAQNTTLINIHVKGDITGERKSVGGIVGELQNSIIMQSSYSQGTVIGDKKSVGGIVGYLDNSEMHNCYSTGNIIGNNEYSGGIVGDQKASIINNSYSTGNVSSYQGTKGGLVGHSLNSQTINSYWDINSSQTSISDGGIGLTTTQMQTPSTYSTWDTSIWTITNNQYPALK